eukprot:SM000026S08973  [mRNA]  locus=s26:855851:859858:+ [translate_table: standard]
MQLPNGAGGGGASGGGPAAGGGDGVLAEGLQVFESEHFDTHAFVHSKCQAMSEKSIRRLCAELQELRMVSAEEMRKSVLSNYAAFIRTSREISSLEGELVAMRNLLATQAALVHTLADAPPAVKGSGDAFATPLLPLASAEDPEPSELERHVEALPDVLDVLLAERKVDEALQVLEEGDVIVVRAAARDAGPSEQLDEAVLVPFKAALAERRSRLAEQLAEGVRQPSVRGPELRAAIAALERLGDWPRAHTLMLNTHKERLQHQMRSLRPSGASYGGAYTAALSQLVFSTILQASQDSVAIFGDQPANASELVLWAHAQTEACADLLRRHVLSSSAAAGGLRAAAECVQIALGHCSLLEEQGLSLNAVLSKLVRPSVEQALDANLRRIEDSVSAAAAVDDWVLSGPASQGRTGRGTAGQAVSLKLSSSAQKLYYMVQEFLEDVAPIVSMHLTLPTLDGLANLFEKYVNLLIKALPPLEEEEGMSWDNTEGSVKTAKADSQQLALLGNAAALADELLPRAATRLTMTSGPTKETASVWRHTEARRTAAASGRAQPEHKDWRRRLQRAVDRLRDNFCTRLVAELMYGEGAEARLSADEYLVMDHGNPYPQGWQQDPMPSPPFQALLSALTSLQATAGEVLVKRERVVQLLLMRLTEALVIALTSDADFWDSIESGPYALGPTGLQQFVLDMNFVMQIATHGRYSSRAMRQVASDSIARAINAFSSQNNADPNSILPGDEWFEVKARETMTRLLENPANSTTQSGGYSTRQGGHEDPGSPKSVSNVSISSTRSGSEL